jgi:ParB family chromosome partitioning protein
MARKFGLGRGLSALIPEEDFPDEKQDEAAEVSADISVLEEAPVEVPVSDPAAFNVEADSLEVDSMEVGGLPVDDLPPPAAEELIVDDAAVSELPAEELVMDDAAVSELPVDDLPPPAAEELVVDDEALSDAPVDDSAASDLPVSDAPVDDFAASDLPVSEIALKNLWSNDAVVNDTPIIVDNDSVEQGAVLESNFVVQLAIDRLVPNPGQPRKNFDETELRELADSIKEHGVIMPIIAADTGGEQYTIIAGERRTRAARLAGLAEVPVIIRNYTDQKRMEISLIENIQRSDLNPIEEATAYKNLMDFSGISHEELAARVGKNRSTVSNSLRLLKLSAEMQKSLETSEISAGHARALLSVTDDKQRDKLFREITAKGLSVREAEKKASALNSAGESVESGGAEKEKAKRPPEITDMEEKFIEKLGTKVSISGGLEKGLIRIEYYSMEDLDRLYGLLGPIES